jgi:hypothetical protein
MSKRKSFFIRSEGPSFDSVKKAFEWLKRYPSERGFIAVMGYGNLNGVISDVIGEEAVKSLKRTGSCFLQGKELLLVTERKPIYSGDNLPIVVFFPTTKFLDQMDSIPNISAILVVPWIMKEVELWIKTWNATELGKPKQKKKPLISNKVVEQALRSLTLSVNVSTGITHPLDRSRAIQTFEILRDAGEMFSPDEVKAWLIAEGGWKATHAQEVAEIAQKVLEGKRLRKGAPAWRKDILKIWREEAAKSV